MEVFNLTLQQMLMMFVLIATGFVLRKKRLLPDNAGTVMSKMETMVFVPALTLFSQMTKCTVETFSEHYVLILYGAAITLCMIALSAPISMLFVRKYKDSSALEYQRRIYQYAMSFSNFGFMGNFIILGVWGSDVFFQYSLFTFGLSILANSWGLYILIPKEQNASLLQNLKTGLLKPPIIALVAGIAIGLLDLTRFVPSFCLTALENASSCQGPVAMLLAGFIIGGYDLKELLCNKKVYVASFVRLIVIPAAVLLVLKALGVNESIQIMALVAYGTPLGLNTIVFPAAYGGDPKTGASMTTISHTLSVITIPLMYLAMIVLL